MTLMDRMRHACAVNAASTVAVIAVVAAVGLLAGCGGDGGDSGPVRGTATPVPGTETSKPPPAPPSPTLTPKPPDPPSPTLTPKPSDPEVSGVSGDTPLAARRFTAVAPATGDHAAYMPSPAIAYDLGNLVARSGADDRIFITPLAGWVRYPLASTTLDKVPVRFPVVVFLHGQHDPAVPNYQGYDYLARDLAAQGYVAISIDANAINALDDQSGAGDYSSQSRAQLLLGTLDRLREIDQRGGPGVLDQLKGRLDFSRIGLMGHSRGGQGISNAIKYNITRTGTTENDLRSALLTNAQTADRYPELAAAVDRPEPGHAMLDEKTFASAVRKYNIVYAAGAESKPPYHFRAALMLAPTDFSNNLGLANVPLAVLLPSCDGDMVNLDGARVFDRNRFGFDTDTAPRFQVLTRGANHNFYNTVWTNDDLPSTDENTYCANRPGGIRLNAEDQRRGGLFLINAFMRHFVGGEARFAGYWNGTAQLPEAACPDGKGTCDERVVLSIQKGASHSKLIQRFEERGSLHRNALGGTLALTGFDAIARCETPYGGGRAAMTGACEPVRLRGFEYMDPRDASPRAFLSIADHLQLSWSAPEAALVTDLRDMSAASYDTLTFRVAVIRPMGQEVHVTLTDTRGRSATVAASDFSDALYLRPRPKADGLPMIDAMDDVPFANGSVAQLLDMVAIPLAAFTDVDTGSLAELRLMFPKAAGSAAVTDIAFQHMGRI